MDGNYAIVLPIIVSLALLALMIGWVYFVVYKRERPNQSLVLVVRRWFVALPVLVLAATLLLWSAQEYTQLQLAQKNFRSKAMAQKKNQVRHVVEEAVKGITSLRASLARRGLSHRAIQQIIKERLSEVSYAQGRGYIFVKSFDGMELVNRTQPELVGRNIWDKKGPDGGKIVQRIINTGKKIGSGFVVYPWRHPKTGKMSKKVSYVRALPEWRWVVGSGLYAADLEQAISQKEQAMYGDFVSRTAILLLSTLLALLASWAMGSKIKERLSATLQDLEHSFADSLEKHKPLASNKMFFAEMARLAQSFNEALARQQRAETELKDSKDFLDMALTGTEAGIWKIDLRSQEITLHELQNWRAILGYTEKDYPIFPSFDYNELRALIHPDDAQHVGASLDQILQGKKVFNNVEYRMRHKDGHWVWVNERGKVTQRDAEGRPLVMHGSHIDISERKEAEERAERNRQWLGVIIDQIPFHIWAIDKDYRYILQNEASKKDFGDVKGLRVQELPVEPELLRRWLEQDERTFREGKILTQEYESLTQVRKRFYESTLVPLWEGGRVAYVIGIVRDITEGKEAERALRESEEKFRSIAENTSDGVIVLDASGHIQYVSPAYISQLGYPQEVELERDENAIYELIHPEERDNLFGEIQRAIQRHKRGLTYRYRVRHVDGHYIWREDNARFVYDEQGRHLHSYVVCRDITQRKRIEEEMERARQEAVEANKAKSRFLASMSHEIRTPMNAIMGMTDMALMTPDEGEQHEHLLTVKESAHHLMGIINDVLDISKVEAGRMQLERKPFSLHHALETVYRIFLGEIKYKGLDFTLYLDPQLPDYVVCDEVRLRQVVANLVSNARKFTDAGKIELNVYLLERLEAADAKQGEDLARIAIEVADTGIGIPKHRQKDIFSMFEQADSSTTRRYGGTGLGLSISKQLVDLMGGEITVASEPAHGSTFHIELPLPIFKGSVPKHSGAGKGREASEVHQLQDSTYVAEKPNDSGASAGEGGPWHILLAEDNRVNVKLARRVLQKMGHSVTVVYDGRQVINELYQRGQEFQLILMDIEMPEMDGIEATQRIRRGEAGEGSKSIKIIAMTAHAVADIQDRALNAGMDGYITKPVDITKLQSSMEEIFSRRS